MKKIKNHRIKRIPIDIIESILDKIEKPARYIGGEINSTNKKIENCKVSLAISYPDLYDIGMSNLAIKILYEIVNSHSDMIAERVFSPWIDMEKQLRNNEIPLFSLESKTVLNDFDIIGFSIGYELLYTNILTILDLSNIPFYTKDRDENYPLIIAGGPATANPEPIADFMDAIVIGEGESLIIEILENIIDYKESNIEKKDLLYKLSKIKGVYIPSLHDPKTLISMNNKIKRYRHPDLNKLIIPTKTPLPNIKPIQDRGVIEVSRGCTSGCRFCQAGMTNRPVRERSIGNIIDLAEKLYKESGYFEITLMSLSIADYTNLIILLDKLESRLNDKGMSFSLPSLRIDNFSFNIARKLGEVKKFGLTLAVESGNDYMRRIINKKYTEEKLLEFIKQASEYGWNTIKLYFMIGLPVENGDNTEESAIVELLNKISEKASKRMNINANIGIFIPKAHTPFQWVKMITINEAYKKVKYIKRNVNSRRIHIKYVQPEVSFLEGLLSLSGRNLSKIIENVYHKGARFDGWQEMFSLEKWIKACGEENYNFDDILYSEKTKDYVFPWDHIDVEVNRNFLYKEFLRSKECLNTDDCRTGCIENCGSCNKKIKKVLDNTDKTITEEEIKRLQDKYYKNRDIFKKQYPDYLNKESTGKIRLTYKKTGFAKYIGHLDLTYIMLKLIFISDIPIIFSKGFNPTPKLEFAPPLSVGFEGNQEMLEFKIYKNIDLKKTIERLNENTLEGIEFTDLEMISDNKSLGKKLYSYIYTIEFNDKCYYEIFIDKFKELNNHDFIISKKNKKKFNHIINWWINKNEYKLNVEIEHTQRANISINDIIHYINDGIDKNQINNLKLTRENINIKS